MLRGRPEIANAPGTPSCFCRRNYSGNKAAKKGDYEACIAKGHSVVLLLSRYRR